MTNRILTAEVRVRTSEGEALFTHVVKGKAKTLGNELPGRWVKFPAGSTFTLCAKFEKTDTFMLAVSPKAEKGKSQPVGVILRRMSYEKLLATSEEVPEIVKAPKAPKATVAEIQAPEAPAADAN